jgi:hypothetical protein
VLACARPTGAKLRIAPANDSSTALVDAIVDAGLGAGQAVTGRSAAWLHGIGPQPGTHSLWLPPESGRVKRQGLTLRYGGRPAGDIVTVAGLPALDPEGSIIETARMPLGTFAQREDELLWMMSRGDARRLVSPESVEERALDVGQFTGCQVLYSAVAKAKGTLSHSKVEGRSRHLTAEALDPLDLCAEPRPYEVWVNGTRIAEADIAVVAISLDIEVDGPHHRFLRQREKDERRDRLLRRAGWGVERFPVELVDERPKAFVAQVRAAAEARLQHLSS